MITFPPEFVTTKYSGYYWNTKTLRLFSIKSGELKELYLNQPNKYNFFKLGYRVSVKGVKHFMTYDALKKLSSQEIQVVYRGLK